MNIPDALIGWALVLWTSLEAFEQVILPCNDARPFRISSLALRMALGNLKGLGPQDQVLERLGLTLSF